MSHKISEQIIELNIIGEGKSIVFIHGALVNEAMWKYQVEFFRKRLNVITFDMPGHGKSKNIELINYNVEELAQKIMESLDNYSIDQFYLCGHSLGGMVAQEIAIKHPKRLLGLILAETTYGTKSSLFEKLGTFMANLFMRMISQKQLISMSAKNYGKCSKETEEYIREVMSTYTIEESKKVMGAATTYSSLLELVKLKINTLILVGACNRQTHKQAQKLNKKIKNSKYVSLSNAHHILCLDNPDEFNKEVFEFIKFVENRLSSVI